LKFAHARIPSRYELANIQSQAHSSVEVTFGANWIRRTRLDISGVLENVILWGEQIAINH